MPICSSTKRSEVFASSMLHVHQAQFEPDAKLLQTLILSQIYAICVDPHFGKPEFTILVGNGTCTLKTGLYLSRLAPANNVVSTAHIFPTIRWPWHWVGQEIWHPSLWRTFKNSLPKLKCLGIWPPQQRQQNTSDTLTQSTTLTPLIQALWNTKVPSSFLGER